MTKPASLFERVSKQIFAAVHMRTPTRMRIRSAAHCHTVSPQTPCPSQPTMAKLMRSGSRASRSIIWHNALNRMCAHCWRTPKPHACTHACAQPPPVQFMHLICDGNREYACDARARRQRKIQIVRRADAFAVRGAVGLVSASLSSSHVMQDPFSRNARHMREFTHVPIESALISVVYKGTVVVCNSICTSARMRAHPRKPLPRPDTWHMLKRDNPINTHTPRVFMIDIMYYIYMYWNSRIQGTEGV